MDTKQTQLDLHMLTLGIAGGIRDAIDEYITYGSSGIDQRIFGDCVRKQVEKIQDERVADELAIRILSRVGEAIKADTDDEARRMQPLNSVMLNVNPSDLNLAVFMVALHVTDAVEEYDEFRIIPEYFSNCLYKLAGMTTNELAIPVLYMMSETVVRLQK